MKAIDHLVYFFRRRDSLVIGLVFAMNSFVFGNWVTRIPDVKLNLALTDATLGLALLGAPLGALAIMPLAGWIIARFQLGKATFFGTILHFLAPLGLALATNFWALFMALIYFGLTNAFMDIAMNAAAAVTERKTERHIMSTCHGMWSLGAMLGAASGSLIVGLGLDYIMHLLGAALFAILITMIVGRTIFTYQETRDDQQKVFAMPNMALLGLAAMAFCILMSEGAIADWSAIYMKETLRSDPFLVGLAYSNYSFLMALGRFSGDSVIPRIGKKRVVLYGALISVAGLAIALTLSDPVVAIIGFGLTGLGYSCVVPVLFTSAANEPGYTSGTGIAAVSIVGYTGFLAGPPVIGILSESYGMSNALWVVVFMSLAVAIIALKVTFK